MDKIWTSAFRHQTKAGKAMTYERTEDLWDATCLDCDPWGISWPQEEFKYCIGASLNCCDHDRSCKHWSTCSFVAQIGRGVIYIQKVLAASPEDPMCLYLNAMQAQCKTVLRETLTTVGDLKSIIQAPTGWEECKVHTSQNRETLVKS